MKIFEVKEIGIRFQHSKKWTPKCEKKDEVYQIHLIPATLKQQDTFGIIIVENLKNEFTLEEYLLKGKNDLKTIEEQTPLVIQNINSKINQKFSGTNSATLEYEIQNPEAEDLFFVNATILLRNGIGYVFQINGPKKTYNKERIQKIFDTVQFF